MKKLALGLGLAVVAGSTLAANVGWYAGVQAGWNKYYNTSTSGVTAISNLKTKSTSGLGWGVHGGYNFMKNFGLQLGYQNYSDLTFKQSGSSSTVLKAQYYDISLLAMGYLPLDNQFDLFGGAGVAYLHEKVSGSALDRTTNHNFMRPKVALGFGYNFNQNMNVNLSYSYIFGKGKIKDALNNDDAKKWQPSIGLLALGVDYSF